MPCHKMTRLVLESGLTENNVQQVMAALEASGMRDRIKLLIGDRSVMDIGQDSSDSDSDSDSSEDEF